MFKLQRFRKLGVMQGLQLHPTDVFTERRCPTPTVHLTSQSACRAGDIHSRRKKQALLITYTIIQRNVSCPSCRRSHAIPTQDLYWMLGWDRTCNFHSRCVVVSLHYPAATDFTHEASLLLKERRRVIRENCLSPPSARCLTASRTHTHGNTHTRRHAALATLTGC